jgi:hypothetical protein
MEKIVRGDINNAPLKWDFPDKEEERTYRKKPCKKKQ